jgi:hypothetical protein
MNQETAKYIIVLGACLVAFGIILYFFHDKLHWIGRLPGDIRIEKENFRFFFPISTMILFSALLAVILWVIRKI